MVYAVASDKKDLPRGKKGRIWFEGDVHAGETFTVDARSAGEKKLKSKTYVFLFDEPGGTLLQTVEIHTSCSQPLRMGNQFGSLLLRTHRPEEKRACEGLELRGLAVEYTGAGCATSHNRHDARKSDCEDLAGGLPQGVFVRAGDRKSADGHGDGKLWFEGEVELGATIVLDAENAGATKLASETIVQLFNEPEGTLLQTITIHTSCSQPLDAGDSFGALTVRHLVAEEKKEKK
jgi:hypothetical protein